MTDHETRKLEKQIKNEELEVLDRERLVSQIQDAMDNQHIEIADLVRRNPKLQNTQIKNYIRDKKDIKASTLNHIADALGGRIDFVPPGRRRRK